MHPENPKGTRVIVGSMKLGIDIMQLNMKAVTGAC